MLSLSLMLLLLLLLQLSDVLPSLTASDTACLSELKAKLCIARLHSEWADYDASKRLPLDQLLVVARLLMPKLFPSLAMLWSCLQALAKSQQPSEDSSDSSNQEYEDSQIYDELAKVRHTMLYRKLVSPCIKCMRCLNKSGIFCVCVFFFIVFSGVACEHLSLKRRNKELKKKE